MQLSNENRENIKNIMVAGITLAGSFITKKIIEKTKTGLTGNEPPKNPEKQDISWKEAVIWAVSTGAFIGLVKLILRRNLTIGADKFLSKE